MYWKIILSILAFAGSALMGSSRAAAQSANNNLTCNYSGWAIPPVTDTTTVTGTDVGVRVGINRDFGGVGVQFDLINNLFPRNPLNILEARSAAGSGWQTSYLFIDQTRNRFIVFNQGAGNAVSSQWGLKNTFDNRSGLRATSWNPLYSDHIHPNRNWGVTIGTSPCQGNALSFDDGMLTISTNTVRTKRGTVVSLTNQYTLRPRVNQSWESWAIEQAFYLNKRVASEKNLRVYLRGYGKTWLEGPIRPSELYSIQNSLSGSCTSTKCDYQTKNLEYAVMVWNVMGRDIGVAIRPNNTPSFYGHLNMVKSGIDGCSNPSDHNCGSIDWHTVLQNTPNFTAIANLQRKYAVTYYVGTLEQLADLGFTIK
ncbi:MAG: hypothetical protein HC908_05385 [Calothrix sp. SM1_7_51]|nr:hypothetical protein [Calothrix sp. SM1_7_51]